MHKLLNLMMLTAVLSAQSVLAHPVTYQGGLAYMSWNSPMMSDHWLSYSATRQFALTARYLSFRGEGIDGREYLLPQANYLVKRWNELDSQANIYLSAGYGASKIKNNISGAALGALEADWESRKYYVSGKYQSIWTSGIEPLSYSRFRVGYSPYLADFENLQTWLMVQAEYQPQFIQVVEVTPLLRFFYHNVLWEAGASLRGNWLFNLMVHF